MHKPKSAGNELNRSGGLPVLVGLSECKTQHPSEYERYPLGLLSLIQQGSCEGIMDKSTFNTLAVRL